MNNNFIILILSISFFSVVLILTLIANLSFKPINISKKTDILSNIKIKEYNHNLNEMISFHKNNLSKTKYKM